MNLQMSSRGFLSVGWIAFVAACFQLTPVRADYILTGGGAATGTYRIRDNGAFVQSYIPPDDVISMVEAHGTDIALTPDLSTLYQFTNTLGFSNVIFAYNAATGEHLPDKLLQTGPCCTPIGENYIASARMPVIRPHDFLQTGDMFVISDSFGFFDPPPKVKQFNRSTNKYVATIEAPQGQSIYDIAFGIDNRLYMAVEGGIFVFQEMAGGFELVSPTPLTGNVTGAITFDPIGQLYVRDFESGDVLRYLADGTFVDTFVPDQEIGGERGPDDYSGYPFSIHFGSDGNLHVLIDGVTIGKYSGSTGDLLEKIDFGWPNQQLSATGRIFYTPIPEPSALLLAMVGAVLADVRSRRNSRLKAAGVALFFVVAIAFPSASRADYIVNGGDFFGTFQVRDDGSDRFKYYVPSAADRNLTESVGQDIVVSPDLQTLYQFTNSVGMSNLAFVYDARSRQYQSYAVLGTNGPPPDYEIWLASMSLIRKSDPLGLGDLFVISGTSEFPISKRQIKRFNRETSSYVETVDPPMDQRIQDFGFGLDDRLYVAAENGIYVYQESASGFDLVSSTPLLGSLTGKLTFGQDGNMYLVNPTTQRIERYATDGTFIDTFSDVPFSGINSIQFGVDGNLHILAGSIIQKLDGATGDLLATINFRGNDPVFQYSAYGRITYLPIPEPSAILPAAICAALVGVRCRQSGVRR